MQFKLHEKNIPQIRACVNAYGEVWVHGSGDIFPVYLYDPAKPNEQDHSQIQHEHFNKGQEENSYRVKINKNNMPKSVKELERLLEASKTQEHLAKRAASTTNSAIRNVVVSDADYGADFHEPEGEIDYQALYNKSQEQPVLQSSNPKVVAVPQAKKQPGRKPKAK